MSTSLEFKGKDVDAAIRAACNHLQTNRDELQIEVISTGSAGIFGLLRRKALVRVILQEKDSPQVVSDSPPSPPPTPAAPETPTKPAAQQATHHKNAKPSPRREPTPVPVEFHDLLRQELTTLLTLMKMEGEVSVDEAQGKTRLHITGPCVTQLTNRGGQALDGLQYLLGKITSKNLPERAMFIVDADNYRHRRQQELQELALRLATEVKEGKTNRTIPPLSPAERRIVHMTLQDDRAIRSRSVGSGLFKKVLIFKPGSNRPRRRKKGKGNNRKK